MTTATDCGRPLPGPPDSGHRRRNADAVDGELHRAVEFALGGAR